MIGFVLELVTVFLALGIALLVLGSFVAIQSDGFRPRVWFTALTAGLAGVFVVGLVAPLILAF